MNRQVNIRTIENRLALVVQVGRGREGDEAPQARLERIPVVLRAEAVGVRARLEGVQD